eukprot:s59_g7.t1
MHFSKKGPKGRRFAICSGPLVENLHMGRIHKIQRNCATEFLELKQGESVPRTTRPHVEQGHVTTQRSSP